MKAGRMLRIVGVAVGLVLAGLVQPAGGTTLYVDPNGSADFTTIQAAIDASWDGNEIEVAPGTYNETIDFSGKAVKVYSREGQDFTTIDGGYAPHVVQCVTGEGPNTVLEGFTITGGRASGFYPDDCGGGMYNYYSSPTVKNCNFIYNEADSNGGGMYNEESSTTVTNCTFYDNYAAMGMGGGSGGGMYNLSSSPTVTGCTFKFNDASIGMGDGGGMYNDGSSPTVTNCTFTDNSATGGGGGICNKNSSSPAVANCAFSRNMAGGGGGIFNDSSSPTVTNCTFSENRGSPYGGGMYNWSSSPTVTNCIFWGDVGDDIYDDGGSSTTVSYSDVKGGWSGAGGNNINANPVLCGDLRLGACSPCVDAGNNNSVPADSSDLDGDGNTIEPLPFDLGGNARFVDDANVADTGAGTPPIVDMGAYERQGNSVVWGEINVPGDFNNIQEAIDEAYTGDRVIVAPGTYDEVIDLKGKAIGLCSNDGPEVTAIDGTGYFQYHVVKCVSGEDANTILAGFTITGGNANGSYTTEEIGGGMYCLNSSPTVTSCIFTGNTASTHGGGMYCENGSPTVTNCVFTGNTADYDGGGICDINSSPTVTNCTFSGNTADANGGGMYNGSSSPTVTNCIFWGDAGGEVYDDGSSSTTVSYSDVEGGWSGAGGDNIDANPVFYDAGTGDLRVRFCSPCADVGDNNSVPLDSSDLDGDGNTSEPIPFDVRGEVRFIYRTVPDPNSWTTPPIVDMGAYEASTGLVAVYNVSTGALYCSIQEAIDDACDGNAIEVFPGRYDEAIDLKGKAITLRSTDPNDPDIVAATVIDANGLGLSVVTCNSGEGTDTILAGFTITGGSATNGGGMYNSGSSPTVLNCTFGGNYASGGGGGMYNYSSSPTVTNCTFIRNTASGHGGGMYNKEGSATIINCAFRENTAGVDGGGMAVDGDGVTTNPTVTNCLFIDNTAGDDGGGMVIGYDVPTLTNCTFYGNSAADNGGAIRNYDQNPIVTNCILWGNSPDEISDGGGGNSIVTYSDVEGGYSGTGNIGDGPFDDPLFVDANGGDLRLRSCSPCVDAGDNNSVPADVNDLDGDGDTTEPIPYDLRGEARFVDDGGMVDTGIGTPPVVDMGAYERQEDTAPQPVYNVTQDVNCCGIQRAIDDACDGDVIEVAPGRYYDTIDFKGKAITLRSSDPNDANIVAATVIDGTGYYHVVKCVSNEDANTILAGFTITGGNANGAGANASGGGMYCKNSSPTVTNCAFSDNSAKKWGGGMYNYGSGSNPTVSNCTFSGNSATDEDGGGMSNTDGEPTVTNCVFIDNTAGDKGGGMANGYGAPTVTNCTFTRNSAKSRGGGIRNYGGCPKITSCIFWSDAPDEISSPAMSLEQYLDCGRMISVTYSDVEGGYRGTGNIDAHPLFVNALAGDLRLGPNSPCVDAGNSWAAIFVTTDFDGNPRFVDDANVADTGAGLPWPMDNDITDMGAYERQTDSAPPVSKGGALYWTIGEAIDEASGGDVIEVSPATFPEVIDFNGLAITLRSTDPNDPNVVGATVIDAGGLGSSAVICNSGEGADTVLAGFTITGGHASYGGGMYCENSDPTVINCRFSYNTADCNGGGMYNEGGSPTVTGCVFYRNSTTDGEDYEYYRSEPHGNHGGHAGNGAGMYNAYSAAIVSRCEFIENRTGSGGRGQNGISYGVMEAHNGGYGGDGGNGGCGAGMCNYCSSPTVTDCVFRLNESGGGGKGGIGGKGGLPCGPGGCLPRWGGDGGDGGVGGDGAGMYNYNSSAIVSYCDFSDNRGGPGGSGSSGGGLWSCSCADFAGTNQGDGGDGGNGGDGAGMYNNDSNTIVNNCTFTGNVGGSGGTGGRLCYEGGDGGDGGDGAGICDSNSSPTLINCTFTANVTGEGGDGGSGGNLHPPKPGLDGSGGAGAGVYGSNSSPEVTNCTFSGNSAQYGGGMYNRDYSSPEVTNCTFSGNTYYAGGGMYNYINCNPTVTNCTFSGNSATSFGGGMFNISNSSPTVTNCTFSGNTAISGGGVMLNTDNSNPTVTNCILWGNSPEQVIDHDDPCSASVIAYSDVEGGWGGAGGNNIDADPCFVDDSNPDPNLWNLRLRAGSACIDAGDNAAVPGGVTVDLDGRARFVDGDCNGSDIVDMGAYEFSCADIVDFDDDGAVDFVDYAILSQYWLTGEPSVDIAPQPAGDGIIDERDLDILCENWLFGK